MRSASSNPRVTTLNPRDTSSNPQVTGSNPRVKSSNPRVQESFNQWKLKETALKFPHFLRFQALNRSAVCEATRAFSFWW